MKRSSKGIGEGQSSGSVVICNRGEHAVQVILEPWLEECELMPGASARVVFHGPDGGEVIVEYYSDCIIVYGYTGSVMELLGPEGP